MSQLPVASSQAQSDLEAVIELALAEAQRGGAEEAEAAVNVDQGLSVTVRLGEVETLEYQRDRGLGVTVYVGKRKGSATTADLAPQSVAETVNKALSIARFTAADEFAGLPDRESIAREVPDLDLSHPWELEAETAIDLARACEAAALAADQRINNSEGGSVSTHRALRVYGNSLGFVGGFPHTSHSVSCVVLGQQGEDMQRDHWYTIARDWRDLDPVELVGRRAAERTVSRLGAVKLSTRRAPVLFAPDIARGLIGHFIAAIRGSAQYRRSSFLLDVAGQQIFPDWLSMHERPHLPKGLASAAFDSEGVATQDRDLVVNGVVNGYVLDTYGARKLGLSTTGNAGGLHNLLVVPGPEDQAGLIGQMGTGLLVTELLGQGVNMVTGDYSRGATGFWVENGAIQYPVHEVTIAGNLREMFSSIVAVGSDVDRRGGIRTGSILVGEMTVAGD